MVWESEGDYLDQAVNPHRIGRVARSRSFSGSPDPDSAGAMSSHRTHLIGHDKYDEGMLASVIAELHAAGCVFAEDEAALLIEAASSPADLRQLVDRRVSGFPLEHLLG